MNNDLYLIRDLVRELRMLNKAIPTLTDDEWVAEQSNAINDIIDDIYMIIGRNLGEEN